MAGRVVLAWLCASASALPTGHFSGLLEYTADGASLETFYYYVKHADPNAPLVVWMQGGPGASGLMGLFTELGPQLLNERSVPSTGSSNWTLFSNPSSWSEEASLLVFEQPAGVGFSRCHSGCPALWDDDSSAEASHAFLEAFFGKYKEAAARGLFIAGESYGGVYVPLLAQRLLRGGGGGSGAATPSRLRGIAVGNGCIGYGVSGGCGTDTLEVFLNVLDRVAPGFAREPIAAARDACGAQLERGLSPHELSPGCAAAMRAVFEEAGEYNQYHWASPCGPDGQGNWGDGTSFTCATGVLSRYLASAATQRELGVIGPGEKPRAWADWDGDSTFYNISIADTQPAYRELLAHNVSVLVYEGLADTGVPDVGAVEWVPRVAGAAIAAPRRKWGAGPAGDFAGHVTVYEAGLTYATVSGAGHLVPADRPVSARAMIGAWLRGEPLPPYRGKACKRLWLGRGYGAFC